MREPDRVIRRGCRTRLIGDCSRLKKPVAAIATGGVIRVRVALNAISSQKKSAKDMEYMIVLSVVGGDGRVCLNHRSPSAARIIGQESNDSNGVMILNTGEYVHIIHR